MMHSGFDVLKLTKYLCLRKLANYGRPCPETWGFEKWSKKHDIIRTWSWPRLFLLLQAACRRIRLWQKWMPVHDSPRSIRLQQQWCLQNSGCQKMKRDDWARCAIHIHLLESKSARIFPRLRMICVELPHCIYRYSHQRLLPFRIHSQGQIEKKNWYQAILTTQLDSQW